MAGEDAQDEGLRRVAAAALAVAHDPGASRERLVMVVEGLVEILAMSEMLRSEAEGLLRSWGVHPPDPGDPSVR